MAIIEPLAKARGSGARCWALLTIVAEELRPIEPIAPAVGSRAAIIVEFTWKPYLRTEYAVPAIVLRGR